MESKKMYILHNIHKLPKKCSVNHAQNEVPSSHQRGLETSTTQELKKIQWAQQGYSHPILQRQ